MIQTLLDELARDDVRVWAADGRIRFDGPRTAVTPQRLARLRAHRDELLAHLEGVAAAGAVELRPVHPAPGAPVVAVLPPAGAGPGTFRHWRGESPPDLEVLAVSTPGREDRIEERPYTEVGPLADRIAEAVRGLGDRPVALFGHSSGGLVAREVTRRLPGVVRLLAVGGSLPPDHITYDRYEPTDQELLRDIVAWGGLPAAALDAPETVRAYLPGMRCDMKVFESCRQAWEPAQRVGAPVLAFAGVEDEFAPPAGCADWRRWTTADCRVVQLPGGHPFPLHQGRRILSTVRDALAA